MNNEKIESSKKCFKLLGNYTNEGTLKKTKYVIQYFFNFTGVHSPDTYLQSTKYIDNGKQKEELIDRYENDVNRFFQHLKTKQKEKLKTKLTDKTIRSYLTILKNLFKANKIEIDDYFWKQKERLLGNETTTDTGTLKKQELIEVLNNCNLRSKAIAYLGFNAGLRPDEILKLKFNDIEFIDGYTLVKIRCHSNTTKKNRETFLTKEGTTVLRQYLKQRDEIIKKQSSYHALLQNEYDKNLLFPITGKTLRNHWNEAVKKAGYCQQDEITNINKYSAHSLRRYFYTNGKFSDYNAKQYFSGRMSKVNKAYYQKTKEQLLEDFKTGEASLNLFDNPVIDEKVKTEMSEMQKEMKGLKAYVLVLEENLKMIAKMRNNPLQELQNEFKALQK